MRLLLIVAAAAAASFLKILSPTPVFPYISRWALLPWRSARSQFRILLLPIFRFFRLSPSSSFRSALPLSLAVGSVTLREPTAVRTFLFQTRLLFSLRFSPRLSFLSTLSSLSSFLPFLLPALLSPFLLSPSLSVHFLYWLSALASLTAHLATLHGARQFFFFVRPSTFVSSTFCTDCTEDESEDIFVPDVVSDRLAFLSNLTAPGQLEHSSSPVIVFASWTRHTFPPSSSSEISMEKLTLVRFLPSSTKDQGKLVVRNEDDVVRIVR